MSGGQSPKRYPTQRIGSLEQYMSKSRFKSMVQHITVAGAEYY